MNKDLVVAKKYQLARINGEYSSDAKIKELRSNIKMLRETIERNNTDLYKNSGKWYIIDEEATQERFKDIEIQEANKKQAKIVESTEVVEALKSIITMGSQQKEEKKTRGRKPKAE